MYGDRGYKKLLTLKFCLIISKSIKRGRIITNFLLNKKRWRDIPTQNALHLWRDMCKLFWVQTREYIYTCFFFYENQARNKCLKFTLIGNLMPLLTVTCDQASFFKRRPDRRLFLLETLNLSSKRNSWIHELPFDGRVCLKGNKDEAFLVSLENKAF